MLGPDELLRLECLKLATLREGVDTVAVARATGHKPGAVALWRHRNRLPRKAWPEIIEAFPGMTVKRLKEIEAASKKVTA